MCLGFIDHDKKIMTSLQEYIIWRPDIDDDDAIIMTDFKKILSGVQDCSERGCKDYD